MNRTERAFERRFRELLAVLGAREREKGVRWLFARARHEQQRSGLTLSRALTQQNILLAKRVNQFRPRNDQLPPLFCDAGLGGLARWLRASGCDTHWIQDVTDSDLVHKAEQLGAYVITTDSFLLDRRVITRGRVRAIWVPPSLTRLEQLRLVRAELALPELDSRCMRCGGELLPVDKETVKARIPPKTYLWVNQYFECSRCGHLFWQGTHWRRVSAALQSNGS